MEARFITFEGIEGSGKSTVAGAVHEVLVKSGIPAVITREPGGTGISESIREMLLDPANSEISPRAELLLYLASRAQLVSRVIEPELRRGRTVLCDRFMDASVAYQGWARGLGEKLVEDLNSFAVGAAIPDITFLLDLTVEEGFKRGPESREGSGVRGMDRLEREKRTFHEKVREGYLRISERERKRFVVIDASLPFDEVLKKVVWNLEGLFGVKLL